MDTLDEASTNGYDGIRRRTVAVVGAGVAGLCILRHFALDEQYEVTAFEQQKRIGGVWNYPDGCEELPDVPDTDSRYCRVYRNLRTNSPRPLTHMRDFALPVGSDTYLHRSEVREYISNYAENFDLLRFIKFEHQIVSIVPHVNELEDTPTCNEHAKWKILVRELASEIITERIFDIVFIANGHFHKPYLPEVPEIQLFKGPVIHSSAYRTPDGYADKTVLIIGAGSSGNDLICELMNVATKVIVKHKVAARKFPEKFTTVHEVPHLTSTPDGVILPDGTTVKIDAVILCTGYEFHFPFLTQECRLTVSRGRVNPLYLHMINCHYPTMIIIGLLSGTPFFGAGTEDQILFCKAFLDGKTEIPATAEERILLCEKEFQGRLEEGMPEHRAHMMRKKLWPYVRELAETAGFAQLDPVMEKISNASNLNIVWTPYEFREYHIEKVDSDTFICERRLSVSEKLL